MEEGAFSGTLTLKELGCKGLAIADIISSDPYCIIEASSEGKLIQSFKTKVVKASLDPQWSEEFVLPLYQVKGLAVKMAVWDHDRIGKSDFLGQLELNLSPSDKGLFGVAQKKDLKGRGSSADVNVKGTINFMMQFSSEIKGQCKLFYHNHKFTGLARAISSGESARVYGTYRVELNHVDQVFGDIYQGWNKNYESAQKIFNSPVVKDVVTTQHNHLYSDISITKTGLLENGQHLLIYLKNGYKGNRPRFFTYAITGHTWYFSETGAAFFVDFTSKHAMHACVAEEVRYAGEFHFQKNTDGSFRLVIDNNSGTYAPNKDHLPRLQKLMQLNFPGLEVEVCDFHDEKLKTYKALLQNNFK
eukprot:TRINITY_DN1515_c0_g1_i4.p1 TRINITY_DN1515_c0_g1~~TRINITY_DN1515_c0_g1_i4.p1  ORF type:complete len:359 (-),score=71.40 TRINITY_DN1515_c0_g1_i4:51-1127(-)